MIQLKSIITIMVYTKSGVVTIYQCTINFHILNVVRSFSNSKYLPVNSSVSKNNLKAVVSI
jgi:hypothetical protein